MFSELAEGEVDQMAHTGLVLVLALPALEEVAAEQHKPLQLAMAQLSLRMHALPELRQASL
jgi:hypothetical protein